MYWDFLKCIWSIWISPTVQPSHTGPVSTNNHHQCSTCGHKLRNRYNTYWKVLLWTWQTTPPSYRISNSRMTPWLDPIYTMIISLYNLHFTPTIKLLSFHTSNKFILRSLLSAPLLLRSGKTCTINITKIISS